MHEHKTCDICFALVEPAHLADHKDWHRHMSNLPTMSGYVTEEGT